MMDAAMLNEMKRIREELHGINSTLKRIAYELEQKPSDKEEKEDETTV